jgi:hypothetical protein
MTNAVIYNIKIKIRKLRFIFDLSATSAQLKAIGQVQVRGSAILLGT